MYRQIGGFFMAGFFGLNNYAKSGPGISKDEPQKHSLFLFFELYFRKFWKLVQINLLFFISCIPFLIPFILVSYFLGKNVLLDYLSALPIVGIAVIYSGFTFILRNFAREENAFLWLDFKDTIKSNWRQSIIIGVIDFAAFIILHFSINFYFLQVKTNILFIIPLFLCVFIAMVIIFMQYYLFVMLITFSLTMKQLLRNAAIFSLAGLGRNVLITLFLGLLILLLYIFPIALVLLPFILISTLGFVINFNVWPLVKKFMIKSEESDNDKREKSIFEDNGREK